MAASRPDWADTVGTNELTNKNTETIKKDNLNFMVVLLFAFIFIDR